MTIGTGLDRAHVRARVRSVAQSSASLLTLVLATGAWGATHGRVTDLNGAPLAQAMVTLTKSAPSPGRTFSCRRALHCTALHYASSIVMRLIVDPQTLRPYLRDTRRYWYVTLGKRLPISLMMESDHSRFKFDYR